MYEGYTLGVVVPAYNEELLIASSLRSIPDYVDKVYAVNDGSTDRTGEIIQSFKDKRLDYIEHAENRGVGSAIASGYQKALDDKLDIVAVMAGDFQMDPAYLKEIITPIASGVADYAKGDRFSRRGYTAGMSRWRLLGNQILTLLTRVAAGNHLISDPQQGYTAISRQALERIEVSSLYHGYGYCNQILIRGSALGLRIFNVPIPSRYGTEKSKIRYHRYIPRVSWLLLKSFMWRLRVQRKGTPSLRD